MAWSDSIFEQLDRGKLLTAVQVLRAIQAASDAPMSLVAEGITLVRVSSVPLFGTYRGVIEGETIAWVPGTATAFEGAQQTAGYLVPVPLGTGLINSYYWNISAAFVNAIPANTTTIIGYSLGGAMAWCIGRRLKSAGRNVRVLTIGCPRFISPNLYNDGGWPGGINVHHEQDLVAWTPPNSPPQLINWLVPGLEYWLTPSAVDLHISQPSSPFTYNALANSVGAAYHGLESYAITLTPQLAAPLAIIPQGGSNMPSFYSLKVMANHHDQDVQNPLWYMALDESPFINNSTTLVNDFAATWRSWVPQRQSVNFSIRRYEARKLASVQLNNPAQLDEGSNYRWSDIAVLKGNSSDVGLVSTGLAFPSFVAVGFAKKCGQVLDAAGEVVEGAKIQRGGFGIGGIEEAGSGALGDNKLTLTSRSAWQNIGNLLRTIRPSNAPAAEPRWQMCIVTKARDGLAISAEAVPPFTGSFNYALVTAVEVNDFFTSRNSRKQSGSNLG